MNSSCLGNFIKLEPLLWQELLTHEYQSWWCDSANPYRCPCWQNLSYGLSLTMYLVWSLAGTWKVQVTTVTNNPPTYDQHLTCQAFCRHQAFACSFMWLAWFLVVRHGGLPSASLPTSASQGQPVLLVLGPLYRFFFKNLLFGQDVRVIALNISLESWTICQVLDSSFTESQTLLPVFFYGRQGLTF